MTTEPDHRSYATDTPVWMFAKVFTGTGRTWTLSDIGNGRFVLGMRNAASREIRAWELDRDELDHLHSMIGEALSHD